MQDDNHEDEVEGCLGFGFGFGLINDPPASSRSSLFMQPYIWYRDACIFEAFKSIYHSNLP